MNKKARNIEGSLLERMKRDKKFRARQELNEKGLLNSFKKFKEKENI